MLKRISKDNYHSTTGIWGSKYLLLMLAKYNYSQLAYELLTQQTYPSFGYMINSNATSLWKSGSIRMTYVYSSTLLTLLTSHSHLLTVMFCVFLKYYAHVWLDLFSQSRNVWFNWWILMEIYCRHFDTLDSFLSAFWFRLLSIHSETLFILQFEFC